MIKTNIKNKEIIASRDSLYYAESSMTIARNLKPTMNSTPKMLNGKEYHLEQPSSRGINKNPPGTYLFFLPYILGKNRKI